jgi:hypothetical protein
MERRPNSGHDTQCSALLENDTLGNVHQEMFEQGQTNQYRMLVGWDGTRYPVFRHCSARER